MHYYLVMFFWNIATIFDFGSVSCVSDWSQIIQHRAINKSYLYERNCLHFFADQYQP